MECWHIHRRFVIRQTGACQLVPGNAALAWLQSRADKKKRRANEGKTAGGMQVSFFVCLGETSWPCKTLVRGEAGSGMWKKRQIRNKTSTNAAPLLHVCAARLWRCNTTHKLSTFFSDHPRLPLPLSFFLFSFSFLLHVLVHVRELFRAHPRHPQPDRQSWVLTTLSHCVWLPSGTSSVWSLASNLRETVTLNTAAFIV